MTGPRAAVLAALLASAGAGSAVLAARREAPWTGSAAVPPVLVVSEPAGVGPRAAGRVPAGSRIVSVPLDGRGAPRILTAELAAAGSPCVSFDGGAFLFAGREREEDRDAIFEMRADGAGLRRAAAVPDGDCASPAYLPDGRILFSAPAPGVRAVFAADADGSAVRRLTFHAGGEDRDPAVLVDGRILYAREVPGGAVLLAVHGDGTGVHAFHGPGLPPMLRRRPREARDRGVWFAGTGSAFRIDARRPERAAAALAGSGGEVRAVEPLPGGDLLLSVRPGAGRATFGLRLVRAGGPPEGVPLLDDPDRDETDPALLAPRPRPKGHLSVVKPEKDRGRLYCIDARRTAGEQTAAAAVRIYEALPAEGGPADGRAGRLLGTVPLEADGSFHVEVPADRPLRIEAVGADGVPVAAPCASPWVRPNEIRACIGCHEDQAAAPPNALPAAVLRDPADLAGGSR